MMKKILLVISLLTTMNMFGEIETPTTTDIGKSTIMVDKLIQAKSGEKFTIKGKLNNQYGGSLFCFDENNKLCGEMYLSKTADKTVYLTELNVYSTYLRKGIGRTLFEAAAQTLKALGFEKLVWLADPSHPHSPRLPKLIDFYEGLGGKMIHEGSTSADFELDLETYSGHTPSQA